MTQEKRQRFDFDTFINELKKFVAKNGRYPLYNEKAIDNPSYNLGVKLSYIRRGTTPIKEEQMQKIKDLNCEWVDDKKSEFSIMYKHLQEFLKEKGRFPVYKEKSIDGTYDVGKVLEKFRKGKLKMTNKQKESLKTLGYTLEKRRGPATTFDEFFERLKNFVETNKRFPRSNDLDLDGEYKIGIKFFHIKRIYDDLKYAQKLALNKIGFPRSSKEFEFKEFYSRLAYFKKIKNRMPTATDQSWDASTYLWDNIRLIRCRHIKLDESQIKKLEKLGLKTQGHGIAGIINDEGMNLD